MIAIVNYGLGNVQAILNIYRRLNIDARIASVPEELEGADRYILPGVGAFDWAMVRLNQSGLREPLEARVRAGHPVLGICVGMQIMGESSDEGRLPGLGWIPGLVRRFSIGSNERQQLPHMGWNDVAPARPGGLFAGLESPFRFYFLHSYYFEPAAQTDVLAASDYPVPFAAAIQRGHVFGVQFHPEKSHGWGIQLLLNFSEVSCCGPG